jgi:hypothetical protein
MQKRTNSISKRDSLSVHLKVLHENNSCFVSYHPVAVVDRIYFYLFTSHQATSHCTLHRQQANKRGQ